MRCTTEALELRHPHENGDVVEIGYAQTFCMGAKDVPDISCLIEHRVCAVETTRAIKPVERSNGG